MAKELPYFQFEPAEYLTKDVSFCSLSAQGLFINICAFYWQRQCDLTKEQFLRRFNYLNEFDELIKEGVIDVIDGIIKIKFLDNQFKKATEFSKEQSRKGSLGGRPKKLTESQTKAELNPNESQTKAIREDKIKEDKIKEDNIIEYKINNIDSRKLKFAATLEPFLITYGKDFLNDFYKYWTEPNKSNTKFKQELERTWSLERRLETWAKNQKIFDKEKSSAKKESEPIVAGRQTMETIQKNLDTTGLYVPSLQNQK